MKATEVPNDLLPLHPAHLKGNNWAAKTFIYWNAFHVATLPQVLSEEDLSNWRDAAADILVPLFTSYCTYIVCSVTLRNCRFIDSLLIF